MRNAILLLSWLLFGSAVVCGQNGGGVYLQENSACIGSVIKRNGAGDGFGVAGGANAQLINCTVVENELYKDTSSFILPGYIYCADGQIVSMETYQKREEKNAIGIVFWVNGATTGPRGAVIALDESDEKLQWGGEEDVVNADESYKMDTDLLRDTCCYQNTLKLMKWNKEYSGNKVMAATYCWDYKAHYQKNNPLPETKEIRWCMPTLLYLKQLGLELGNVRQTLNQLLALQPALSWEDFHMEEGDYYWLVNDGISVTPYAYVMNMKTKECYFTELPGITKKQNYNWVRPIFIF